MFKRAYKPEAYQKAKQIVLDLNKNIRDLIPSNPKDADFEKVGHCEVGVGSIDGASIERVIIILKRADVLCAAIYPVLRGAGLFPLIV
jgi:hypothetical protein